MSEKVMLYRRALWPAVCITISAYPMSKILKKYKVWCGRLLPIDGLCSI